MRVIALEYSQRIQATLLHYCRDVGLEDPCALFLGVERLITWLVAWLDVRVVHGGNCTAVIASTYISGPKQFQRGQCCLKVIVTSS